MNSKSADVARVVETTCPNLQLSAAAYFTPLKDLGVDSLDIASIFLAIRENFGVLVPDDEIDALDTIERIALYVDEHQAEP